MRPPHINSFEKLNEVLGDQLKQRRMVSLFIDAVKEWGEQPGSIFLYSHDWTGYVISWMPPDQDERKELIAYGYWSLDLKGFKVKVFSNRVPLDVDMLRDIMREKLDPPYEIDQPLKGDEDVEGG